MSATSHPLAVPRVARPTVSLRTTGVASLSLFAVAFVWAFAQGHTQQAFWSVRARPHLHAGVARHLGRGDGAGHRELGVVVVEFLAVGLGLVTLLGSLRYLDEL